MTPCIASTKPRAMASPRPTPRPGTDRAVVAPLENGSNTAGRAAAGIPGPRSTTRSSTMSACAPGRKPAPVHQQGCNATRSRSRWRRHASSRPAIGNDGGQLGRHVEFHPIAGDAGLKGPTHHVVQPDRMRA